MVECVFENCGPLEHKRVKLVAIKIGKNASFFMGKLEEIV